MKKSKYFTSFFLGTRKQLVAKLYFRYDYGYHVKHTVIPMAASVATAYLAFFIAGTSKCSKSLKFLSIHCKK